MLRVLATEQTALLAVRAAGSYSSRSLGRAQRALDLDQARLQSFADPDTAGNP
jgi:hypothetical protein